jgi:nitrogen-specific signal transduction histidine kinase
MELLALLSDRENVITAVKNALKTYTVYPVKSLLQLEELLGNVPTGLLILDGFLAKPTQVETLMSAKNRKVLLLVEDEYDFNKLSNFPETVQVKDIFRELQRTVDRMLESVKLKDEISILHKSRGKQEENLNTVTLPQVIDAPGKRLVHEQVLLNFAKTLTVNFNLKKLLDHFMDSVMEIIRSNKMSILLREKNAFRIKSHIGMDPYFAENLKLTSESFLIKWLSGHGRILCRSQNTKDQFSASLIKEMELLQSVCSFPMIYKGKLIGVFNIDSKITGDAFYKEELEVIFILCNYLSATIKDIDYYHQIQYQKEFTRNILANMSSGVITINTEERISIFNQKASEMLNLEAVDVIGSDLRRLPSPLGDILYETMVEGKVFRRHETLIKPGNIPIGVSSHRILSEDNSAIGAVIVFTDLSDLKKLEEEKRKADNLEAMNNLIGKIAHEIKNPLTSIQTFTQLLEDKYKDEEFRKFFTVTVMQSVQQLNNLIDKLVIFSSPIDYRPDVYSVNDVIDDIINYVAKDLPAGIQLKKKALEMTIDKNFFIKALYYLILTSADRLSNDDSILLQINQDMKKQDSVEIAVKFSGEPLSDDEREMLLRPLLDIDAFGIELNVPISHKIIEDLHGTLSITSSKEGNALVITLPTTTKSGTSMKDGLSHG